MNPHLENNPNDLNWLPMSEAAKLTPYSAEYLSLLARKKKIASKKVGNVWYTTKPVLESYMKKQMLRAELQGGGTVKIPDNQNSTLQESTEKKVDEALMPQSDPDESEANLGKVRSMQSDLRKMNERQGVPEKIQNRDEFSKNINSSKASSESKKETHHIQDIEEAFENIIHKNFLDTRPKFSGPRVIKSHFRTAFSTKVLIAGTIVCLISLTVLPVPFAFSFFEKTFENAKDAWNDANTVMGFRPGVSKNQILLLDDAGNISIMGHIETGGQFRSYAEDGVAPIVVDSKTEVKNLNSEYLNNMHSKDFTLAFVTANGAVTAENVKLDGTVEAGKTLLVKGAAKLLSALSVGGNLRVFGTAEFDQTLKVVGPAQFEGVLTAKSEVVALGNLSIKKNASIRGGLEVGSSILARSASFRSLGVTDGFSAGGKITLGSPKEKLTIDSKKWSVDDEGQARFDSGLTLGGDLSVGGSSTFASFSSLSASTTNSTSTNAYLSSFVADNSTTTNAYLSSLIAHNATSTNFFADHFDALLTTISSLIADDISVGALSATNSTTTHATTTDLYSSSFIAGNATTTNAFVSSLNLTGATSTNFFSTNGTFDNLYVNTYEQNNGTFAINSSVSTGNIFSVLDTAITTGTLIHQSLTANAGNGELSKGQVIDVTDSTTAGGGFSAFTINLSGSGTGTGNKYLLDLNPGTNKEVVFDSSGVFRPTTSAVSNTNSIGSPSFYWKNGYFDTLTANNLSGTVISGATSAHSWTIGSEETGDLNEALVFQRNSGSGNATLEWNRGANDLRYLSVNYPFNTTYTVNDSSIGTGINLYSGNLTNNTTGGTQKLLSLINTGTGTTEHAIYVDNTGTGVTAMEIAGNWTNGLIIGPQSGNVGIGITNPNYKLEVNGVASTTDFYARNATTTNATSTNSFATTASSTNLFSTSGNIGTLTAGPVTSGPINGQTVSSAANFTGSLAVAGAVTGSTYNGLTISGSGGTLTIPTSSSLIRSGAHALTLTTTASTNVTLPTSGTLYGTLANSITSTDLASSISNETGSGSLVFGTSPTLTTPNIGAATGSSLNLSSGAITSGLINGQTISSAANFTGSLDISGNVGIGTSASPSRLLHLYKATDPYLQIEAGGGNYSILELTTPASGTGYLIKNLSTGNSLLNKSLYLYNSDGPIQFIPNGSVSSAVTIDTSGNLGVGTSVPGSYKLNVNGNTNITGTLNLNQSNGALAINSVNRIAESGGYTTLMRDNGTIGLYLGGTDAGNYYDNTTHYFRGSGGSGTFLTLNSGGAAFGGPLTGGTYNSQTISSAASFTGSLTAAGAISASSFSGSGASLTSLNASQFTAGTVPTARLGSGTANATTFLRGDQTWATLSVGGTGQGGYLSADQNNATTADVYYTVVYNATEWGSGYLNTGTGVFTIPADGAGKYILMASAQRDGGIDSKVVKNSSTIVWQLNTDHPTVKILDLVAGDTLQYQVRGNGGLAGIKSGSNRTYFQLFKLPNVNGADVAEHVRTNDLTIGPGDLVSVSEEEFHDDDPYNSFLVEKADINNTDRILGIISPGGGLNLNDEVGNPENSVLITLAGRVPIKVTEENGPIHKGDYLTVSPTMPGYSAKAIKRGMVFAQALENSNNDGEILAFIVHTYYVPGQESDTQIDSLVSTIASTTNAIGLNLADASAGLDISRDVVIRGALKVDHIGSIGDLVALESDVEFIGRPYFNSDTGGVAIIEKGSRQVDVKFERAYSEAPVISASVTLNASTTPVESDSILAGGADFVVTNRSGDGFSILLANPAPEAMQFSWIALAIKNLRISNSADTLQPGSEAPANTDTTNMTSGTNASDTNATSSTTPTTTASSTPTTSSSTSADSGTSPATDGASSTSTPPTYTSTSTPTSTDSGVGADTASSTPATTTADSGASPATGGTSSTSTPSAADSTSLTTSSSDSLTTSSSTSPTS